MSNQKLFGEIFSLTASRKLSWEVIGNNSYSALIYQPNYVFRIFKAKFIKNNMKYDVLLVEKKYDDPEWDYAIEKYKPELIFIHNGAIALLIDEHSVDISDFVNLVKLVESNTPQARNLFS